MKTNDPYRQIAKGLLHECSDAALAEKVERSLESRFVEFRCPTDPINTAGDLVAAVASLLRLLGISADSLWSEIEACRQLERLFPKGGARAALLVTQAEGSPRNVATKVYEQIVAESKLAVVTAALARAIDMADAEQRLKLARALINAAQAIVPLDVRKQSPGQIADDLLSFIHVINQARAHLKESLLK